MAANTEPKEEVTLIFNKGCENEVSLVFRNKDKTTSIKTYTGWKIGDSKPPFKVNVDVADEPNAIATVKIQSDFNGAYVVRLVESNGRWFTGGDWVGIDDGIVYDAFYQFDGQFTDDELDEGFATKEEAIDRARNAWNKCF